MPKDAVMNDFSPGTPPEASGHFAYHSPMLHGLALLPLSVAIWTLPRVFGQADEDKFEPWLCDAQRVPTNGGTAAASRRSSARGRATASTTTTCR